MNKIMIALIVVGIFGVGFMVTMFLVERANEAEERVLGIDRSKLPSLICRVVECPTG